MFDRRAQSYKQTKRRQRGQPNENRGKSGKNKLFGLLLEMIRNHYWKTKKYT